MANRNISEYARTWALLGALEKEHLDVFQALLANGNNSLDLDFAAPLLSRLIISEDARRQAILIASQNGRFDFAKLLKKKHCWSWLPIVIGSAAAVAAWMVNQVFFTS